MTQVTDDLTDVGVQRTATPQSASIPLDSSAASRRRRTQDPGRSRRARFARLLEEAADRPPEERRPPMKLRGDGRCCLRDRTWWVQFYVDGKQQRESAKTTDRETGEKYLRRRLKEVHAHELDPSTPFVSRHDKRRTIAELLDALKVDYEIREKDSPQNLSGIARARAAHLPPRPRTGERFPESLGPSLRESWHPAPVSRSSPLRLSQHGRRRRTPKHRDENLRAQNQQHVQAGMRSETRWLRSPHCCAPRGT